jgi:hypothetical protein
MRMMSYANAFNHDQNQKRFIRRLSTQHAMYPGLTGCRPYHAWRRKLIVPDRLWYRTDCFVRSYPFRPGQLPGRSSVINGELQAGGNSTRLKCLTGVLVLPSRRPPWTACVHFRNSYPIDVSHLNFKILCLLFL